MAVGVAQLSGVTCRNRSQLVGSGYVVAGMAAVTVCINIPEWLGCHIFMRQEHIQCISIASMAICTHILVKMNAVPFAHCLHMTIRSMAGDARRLWRSAAICQYGGSRYSTDKENHDEKQAECEQPSKLVFSVHKNSLPRFLHYVEKCRFVGLSCSSIGHRTSKARDEVTSRFFQ